MKLTDVFVLHRDSLKLSVFSGMFVLISLWRSLAVSMGGGDTAVEMLSGRHLAAISQGLRWTILIPLYCRSDLRDDSTVLKMTLKVKAIGALW